MHEAIETLKLFVEKVGRLQASSLLRTLLDHGSQLKFSWTAESGVLNVSLTGPHAEQVDAFVLTMRLFMQDNDRISIRNVAGLIESLPVAADLKKHFRIYRTNLNQFLEGDSMFAVDDDHPTRREVLETVIYGHLSHVEPARRARYGAWVADPLAGSIVDFEFVGVLHVFLRTLLAMAEINRRVVAALEAAAAGATGDAGSDGS